MKPGRRRSGEARRGLIGGRIGAWVGRVEEGVDRRNDRDVVAEHAEVRRAELPGPGQRDRRGRGGGLEPDREVDDLPGRVVDRYLERVERRVHEPDAAPAA